MFFLYVALTVANARTPGAESPVKFPWTRNAIWDPTAPTTARTMAIVCTMLIMMNVSMVLNTFDECKIAKILKCENCMYDERKSGFNYFCPVAKIVCTMLIMMNVSMVLNTFSECKIAKIVCTVPK